MPDPIDQLLQDECAKHGVAITVSVAPPRRNRSEGRAPVTTHVSGDPIESFPIFSITKTFIALCMCRFAARELVSLDEPLVTFVTDHELPEDATIRHLLNHTAGLPDYGALPAYRAGVTTSPEQPWSTEQFIDNTLELPLHAVGSWHYSNIGFMLAKQILERISGKPFSMVIEDEITRPLALESTFVAETKEALAACSPGFSRLLTADHATIDIRSRYHPGWVAHGLIVSTAEELISVLDFIGGESALPPQFRNELFTPVKVPDTDPLYPAPEYGLGICTSSTSRFGPIWGHGGSGPGYQSEAVVLPERDIVVVGVANGDWYAGLKEKVLPAVLDHYASPENRNQPSSDNLR